MIKYSVARFVMLLLLTPPALYTLPSLENKSRAVEVLAGVFDGRNGNVTDGQIEEASLLLLLCLRIKNILNSRGKLIRIIVEAHCMTFVCCAC